MALCESLIYAQIACFNQETPDKVAAAAIECQELAESAAGLCDTAKGKGEEMRSLSGSCQRDMKGMSNSRSLAAPQVFLKIHDIIENNKAKNVMDFCDTMTGMAQQVLTKAEAMTRSMTDAIDSLPGDMKEKYEGEQRERMVTTSGTRAINNEDAEAMMGALDEDLELLKIADVEADIVDLEESCVQSRGGLDLFTAATTGATAFEKTESKGVVCQNLFQQMQDLCSSLARIAQAYLSGDGCCAQIRAVVDGIASLFRCRALAQILTRAAQAAIRLVAAIITLVRITWQKVQGFMKQFKAAKKIGKFVSGVGKKMNHIKHKMKHGILGKIL